MCAIAVMASTCLFTTLCSTTRVSICTIETPDASMPVLRT